MTTTTTDFLLGYKHFSVRPWTTEKELLVQIAAYAYENNLTEEKMKAFGGRRIFHRKELAMMSKASLAENIWTYKKGGIYGRYSAKFEGQTLFDDGYVFLDNDDDCFDYGRGGCLRLVPKCLNAGCCTNYSFWKDADGQIQICEA